MSGRHSNISGVLEQLPFAEFIQTLANLGKTGRLSLARFGERGFVFFRDGRIIGAASTSVRQTLGSLLIGQRLISEEDLAAALEVQRDPDDARPLGGVLLDQGTLSREALQGAFRQQTQHIISELMQWKNGHFEFEAMEIDDEADFMDALMLEGVSAESMLLAGAVEVDEHSRLEMQLELADSQPGTRVRSVASLRDLLVDLRSPEFNGELTAKIMRYVSELVGRCVLFSVQGGYFRGMSYYGREPSNELVEAVRELRIPVGEPSILADVAARREAFKGPLQDDPCNRQIVECLGGTVPGEVIAAPLVVNGRTTMIVYGDSEPGGPALGAVNELELVMLQVGLAMEKKQLENRRDRAEPGPEADVAGLQSADFASLLDADPEPIVVVDANARILYGNEAFGHIFGRSAVDLRGEQIINGVHPDDAADLREIVLEVSRGGAPGGNTVRFRESDDSWRKCYLLPSAFGSQTGETCIMLRALTAGEIHSRFDPLTGLLDYEALVDRLGRCLSRVKHGNTKPFALLFVGIDQFTLVNVQYGWARGNEALRTVANRLASLLRPGDVVSRAGGDRFCVILDHLRDSRDGTLVAGRIAQFLSAPIELGHDEVSLSVSIGVVTSDGDYEQAEDMLNDARVAMAEAKKKRGSAPTSAVPIENASSSPVEEQDAAPDLPQAPVTFQPPNGPRPRSQRSSARRFMLPLAAAAVAVLALTIWLRPATDPDTPIAKGEPVPTSEDSQAAIEGPAATSKDTTAALEDPGTTGEDPIAASEEPGATSGQPVDEIPAPVEPPVQTTRESPLQPFASEAPLTLELRALEEVWVQVSIDGSQVLDTTLQAGQTRTFEGEESAFLVVGNAAGLTVLWNGDDLGDLGAPGRVRRLHFSPTEFGVGNPPPG